MCAVHGRVPPDATSSLAAPEPTIDTMPNLEEAAGAFLTLGYRVHKLLGRGGFGVVYGATRVSDEREVAIKVALRSQPLAAASLAREANALELVDAPHVPLVIERGVLLDQYFVVIEYIASQTLADVLVSEAGPMPLAHFAQLADGILRPLEAIHASGLVHRDLKPENIFVGPDGVAKIIDFGLAKQESSASFEAAATSEQDAIGTAEYMSPEQCDGVSNVDKRSDLYSVGVLFYELLSGAPPFWGQAADVRDAHRSRRPALLSKLGVWPALDAVVRRCLSKDREQRFENVASLRAALQIALAPLREASAGAAGPVSLRMATVTKAVGAGAAGREKRSVGLLFFESRAGVNLVQQLVTGSGGQVVQMNGLQFVAAFGHDVGDNPVRSALLAAQRLLVAKHTARVCVDLASVSVQQKPDGTRRLLSAVFTKKDRFPQPSEPTGITLTSAATEVVPDLNVSPLPERAERLLLNMAGASAATTYGLTPTLLGREAQLGQLRDAARRAVVDRQPTLASVASEPGYGKTHLGRVLAQELERVAPGVEVILLTGRETFVGASSQLLPELLRRLITLPEAAPQDGGKTLLFESLGSELAEQVWAAAAFTLGFIDAEHPDVRRLAAAPGALRLAAARAVGEALRKRAAQSPVVVLVDDAHLVDDAALDALEYATLKEAGAPIFACVLVRPSFEQARPSWATRAACSLKLSLGPLSDVHAMELARRLLHPVELVPPLVLSRLAERTRGVPRLMVELLRGLKRDGLVRRSERGTGYYLATDELDKLPDLPIVQWNASREVEGLPAQLAGHARLSSVLGSNFSVGEVEALMAILERDELPDDMQLDASVGIQRLIDAGMLIRHRNGNVDFRHSLLRDTIYQQVPEAQRTRLHRAAFEMYRSSSMPSEMRVPRLALHALASGEKEAAAAAYLELAERSTKAQAYLEAEAAYGRALESLPADDAARIVLAARGRGLMRFRLGRHEDSLKDLRRARACAESGGLAEQELDLCLDESTVLDWTRDLVQSAALVKAVQARAEHPAPLLAARLGMGLSRVHHRQGEPEACVQLGSDAAEKALALGDAGYETRVIALLLIGTDCCNLGRLDEAERHFQDVIAEARAHADLHHEGAAYINRAFLWFARKDVPRLLLDLARATQIAREIGQPLLEYPALINQAEVAYSIDELDRAADYARRTMELAEQLWSKQNRELGTRELLLARIELYRGEIDKARSLVQSIEARLSAPRAEGADEVDFLPPDQALFEMAQLATRDSSELEWGALLVRAASVELQPSEEVELYEMRALAAHRQGRDEESRRSFQRAIEISREKPNLLSERVMRKYTSLFAAQAEP